MIVQQLVQTLEKKVQQLYQTHQAQQEEKIFTKFDRALFSENGQTTAFYFAEINQTLKKIQSLDSGELNHYSFIAERLLKQCTALSEALNRKRTSPLLNSTALKPHQKRTSHDIHTLPPRERLEKYYEALQQLNHLYQQQRDNERLAVSETEKAYHSQFAERYKKRRQKCQEAIDLLEEYLAFKKKQENKNQPRK